MDDMVAFLQVVEAGGVTAAAAELGLAKSVVSKRLRDLEAALGMQLLRRTTRRVVATEQGQALYARMGPLLREVDDAVEELVESEGPLRGRLRISAPMSFGTLHLGPILLGFAREHLQLELAIDLDDRMQDLVASGHDLAVRIGVSSDASLIARKLCVARRVLCCSASYARERGVPRSIDEIASHPTIDYANVTAMRLWQFEPARRGEKPRSVATRSRIVANNGETMRRRARGSGTRDPAALHRGAGAPRGQSARGTARRAAGRPSHLGRLPADATRLAQGARARRPSDPRAARSSALGAAGNVGTGLV